MQRTPSTSPVPGTAERTGILGPEACLRISRVLGGIAAAVGLAVLAGRILYVPAPSVDLSAAPGILSMKANSALCFVLLGAALLLPRAAEGLSLGRSPGRILGALAALLGLLSLAEYATGASFGIDQALLPEVPGAGPGRMSPTSAINFLLLGTAAFLPAARGVGRLARTLVAVAVAISTISLVGYLYGVEEFQGLGAYATQGILVAATFGIAGLGLLLARPEGGLAAALRSRAAGGVMVRRWLPAAILLPLALGWLRLQGEIHGLYGSRFGLALNTVLLMAALATLVFLSNLSLDRLDAERREAEAERDRYFTMSMDLLCVAGTDGYFKRLNPAWERTLGIPVEELMARPFMEFIHPEDRPATSGASGRVNSGNDLGYFENRYRCGDGSYRWLGWTARAPAPGGSLIYATARDVTDRRRAEEEIRVLNRRLEKRVDEATAANRELEAFSYSVSHDLRAPLRAIEGFSRILVEDCSGGLDREGRRYLDVISGSARQMGQLIDDLLAFSRMGRTELVSSRVDMGDLARTVFAEVRRGEPDRPVELRLGPLPPAVGDTAMLRQVLSNLLSNAVKYTRGRDPAVIEVAGGNGGGECVYHVRDNGVGFDMRYAGKLFGVFQRLHTQEDFEGTGVGLALVKRIVERHGGRAWAEGRPGAGAEFHFTLPAKGASDGGG